MKKQEETRQQELNAKAAEFKALQAQAETVSFAGSRIICSVSIFLSWSLWYNIAQTLMTYYSPWCYELGHAIVTVLIVIIR